MYIHYMYNMLHPTYPSLNIIIRTQSNAVHQHIKKKNIIQDAAQVTLIKVEGHNSFVVAKK